GLETAFPVLYTKLVKPGILSLETLVHLLSDKPRARFSIPAGEDCSVWDLEAVQTVNPEDFRSMGRATPFAGWELYGKCLATVCGGKLVYQAEFR
ncbi:MAG: dihydroorotase, partial [Oscillospiraceae bacterium]|nr:dihydroorotase [Oscillospiraceae bacterium]